MTKRKSGRLPRGYRVKQLSLLLPARLLDRFRGACKIDGITQTFGLEDALESWLTRRGRSRKQ